MPPKHICNLIEDTNILATKIENIKFVYCRSSANKLTDRIAKETNHACASYSCYYSCYY